MGDLGFTGDEGAEGDFLGVFAVRMETGAIVEAFLDWVEGLRMRVVGFED